MNRSDISRGKQCKQIRSGKELRTRTIFLLFISFAIVAIAARQGESRRLNIRKEKAAIPVGNQLATPAATFTASSVSPDTFARTPIVDTIASFAEKPEIEAATGCHSPNPSGAKIGAIAPPIAAISCLRCLLPYQSHHL